jgi:nucleotide-binding universal stress UspA family protein
MFKHVLLATDFSTPALLAAQTAATFARAFESRVTLLNVREPGGTDDIALRLEALQLLREERFGHLPNVEFAVVEGSHAERAIADHVRDHAVDLVVAGRHGQQNLQDRLLGTTTERLVRHAPTSVLVVHPALREPLVLLKHVLVGTDFSEASLPAVTSAGRIARSLDAWVTLMHVYDLLPSTMELLEAPYRQGEEHTLAAAMTRKLESIRASQLEGVPSEVVLERNKNAVAGLCDFADNRKVDLMVMGTHGRTGLSRFLLGSVAERVVRFAPCSVLVVR